MTGETTTVIKFVKLSNVVILKFNGIDSTNVTTPTRMTAFTRVNFVFDIIASTTPSSILIEEEIAAKNKLKKNTIAIIVPPGILSKMIGIVINRSGGWMGKNEKSSYTQLSDKLLQKKRIGDKKKWN